MDGAGRFFLTLLLLFAASLPSALQAEAGLQIDRIVVLKSQHRMLLYHNGVLLKSYRIALGARAVGAKIQQGDHRTPEGVYLIDSKNPHSLYHLALHVSYPNEDDRERAKKMGVSPGGDIMIHGLPDGYGYLGSLHSRTDWTDGCVAVSNREIEELWRLVAIGTPVEIRP